ncbi:hypothetical protein ABZ153_35165 [Streptomyces sp. NPDC006290]|uniref:hypothetical protein n=1 Tax=Streptomyces sp. NPDC006290 TaxID=3156745 RepID=UPI0033BE3BA2
MLFAVGGLALAAGVLSLARMTPDSVTGGGGNTEAEPVATATDNDAAGDAVPTVEAMPTPSHPGAAPASAAMGGTSPAPTSDAGQIPASIPTSIPTTPAGIPAARGEAPVTTAPGSTGIPTAPMTTPPPRPSTPTPTPTAPRHTPSPTTPAPPHQPPDVCVPIVGICVNGLLSPGHGE